MTERIVLPDLDIDEIRPLVQLAVREDIGPGDLTSLAVVPEQARAKGVYVAKGSGVIAGLPVLPVVFDEVDSSLAFEPLVREGSAVAPGARVARIEGKARSILSAERVSLNFLQLLSGIATLAARYVEKVGGTSVRILDTRKTTPGWRHLEKYAARAGGAENHRMGLFDMVLIKDNHLELSGRQPITDAVTKARKNCPPGTIVEVEVESLDHVKEALAAGADIIMLDNMSVDQMEQAVKLIRSGSGTPPKIEASGNVTLDTVAAIARTGVDMISVGEITHSPRSLDISLSLEVAD